MDEQDRLRPYVPGFVVDWLRERPAVRHRQVEGTLAFVDVSGFTRLTERLAARGKVGAEEMSNLLDSTFAALLAVAYAHGAWLVKWGGDAVLLLFQDDDGDADSTARACTAAVEMRRTMDDVGRLRTSCGPVRLRVSTGIHSGRFDVFLVGSSHRELVITGPDATTTAATEAAAAAGQVAVSPAAAARLAPGLVRRRPDGLQLVVRSPGCLPQPLRRGRDQGDVDLGTCLPAPTREHLLTGDDEAEHRLVAVAFVRFSGVDGLLAEQGPGAATAAVDAVVRACQQACTRHGVSFWETDIDKDGGKVMLVAGAPGSTGDQEDALLAVAREVVEAGSALTVRVGVNSGRVFFGQFGPPYRRTMSVKGDAVNLAARLCARAPDGQVLAAATTLGRARTPFAVEALPPFLVKGKAQPVHACLVGPPQALPTHSPAEHGPLMGRTAELAVLRTRWETARLGRLQTCAVVGEAGVGTTRLVHELARTVVPDATLVQVRCDPYTATTAYAPLRRLLRPVVGAAADATAGEAGAALLTTLAARAPELLPWAPLLATVLSAHVPGTPEVDALDERFALRRQEEAAVDLLVRLLPGPALVVIDDAHLLDPSSAALLDRLAERAPDAPWLVVRCGRVDDAVADRQERLVVPPLEPAEALALVHALTEDSPLAAHEADLLVRRSGGNPLFLTELAAAVADGDRAHRAEALDTLPSSVEGVLAARIDRLAPADRRLLRAAAVLGLDVDADLLRALGERVGLPPADDAALARLGAFLVRAAPHAYRFRQAVVQETAYEGLAYSRRSQLHGAVGELLVERGDASADEHAAVLSLHFARAGRPREAWHYARLAAGRAHAALAHAEAVELYARALAAGRQLDDAAGEVHQVWEALGDVRFRLGQFADAATAYAASRRQLVQRGLDSPLDLARLHHKTALCTERSGSYRQALRWSSAGRRLLGTAPSDAAAQRLAAETLVVRATVRHWQGRHVEAARECRRAVELASAAGALDVVAETLVWLDVSELMVGRGDGGHAREALALLRQLGDRPWQTGRCLNELGIRAYFAGDWNASRRWYRQCREAFEEAGDAWAASLATANEAEILCDQGRLPEAEPLLQAALRAARASGALGHTAFVLGLLGRLESRAGRHEAALSHLTEAQRLYEGIGEHGEAVETRLRVAESHVLAGHPEDALAELDALGADDAPPLHLRVLGQALTASGRAAAGRTALEAAVSLARERDADHDLALSLSAVAWWHRVQDLPVPPAVRREASALAAGLGIVDVVDPPGVRTAVGS